MASRLILSSLEDTRDVGCDVVNTLFNICVLKWLGIVSSMQIGGVMEYNPTLHISAVFTGSDRRRNNICILHYLFVTVMGKVQERSLFSAAIALRVVCFANTAVKLTPWKKTSMNRTPIPSQHGSNENIKKNKGDQFSKVANLHISEEIRVWIQQ